LSVTDGPAAGCRLTFESEGMSSDDLRRLIDQPPSASDLGGYAAFHPRPAGLTARGRAPFRSQVLASLGAGTADDVVDCLRQFLRGHDCVTLTIEDQEGRQLRLDGPDTPLGAWQTATEILKNRAER
jgi:hypothetical protein